MKTQVILIIGLLFALILAACGAPAMEAPSEAEFRSDQVVVENQAMDVAVEKAAAPQEVPLAQESGQAGNAVSLIQGEFGRMVLKDALMDLLVEDTDRAIDEVTDLVANQGGYIISSRTWFDGDNKYASVRMGVPAVNFERTLTFLRAFGIQVLNETASGQDVTAEYTDLESRLNNLEATAARVRAFLDDAKTVEESLRINNTLSDLEGQIEQIKGQMKYYEDRAAYSTIEVNLNPLIPTPTPLPTPTPVAWNPGETVKDASRIGVDIFQTLIDALIWLFLGLWPLILFVGLIVALIWWLRGRKKSKVSQAPPKVDHPDQ